MIAKTPEPAQLTDYEREALCDAATRIEWAWPRIWRAAERILTDRLAARDAEHAARLAAVEAERDEAGEGFAQVVRDASRTFARNRLLRRRLARVEAERDRLHATLDAVETLADWRVGRSTNGVDRMIPASDLRAVLDQHPGADDTREGA